MPNSDTQTALRYHDGTKHPDGFLMSRSHAFDPMRQPLLFKIYRDLEPIPLPLDPSPRGMAALSAISSSVDAGERAVPDLGELARVLHYSAGVTKKIDYPWGEMSFRAAACTGALYHIELYVVCGELPGLEAGVYHFDPSENALRALRGGDHRRILIDATGGEPSVADAPAIIVYSDVIWRNACKYQAREYRHAFWDSGTIISHTLAMAAAAALPARVVAGFVDESVNRLLDLDPAREVALALLPIGHSPDDNPGPPPEVRSLSLETVPIDDDERDFPVIREIHEASSLSDASEVAAWRAAPPPRVEPSPPGHLVPLPSLAVDEMGRDPVEAVIARRGSTRRFAHEAISLAQLSTVLRQATQGVPADFLEPLGESLIDVYLIVNNVGDLDPGTYVFRRERQAIELLQGGSFRDTAGALGLQQALPADASANLYLMADLGPILGRFGNRGYRCAQLEASIIAGRIYLAAYAQRLGATGLTFFDDAVTKFFSPHARGKSVMFLVALGVKARRR